MDARQTVVKLDCEGCEFAVLGPEADGLAGLAALVGELHVPRTEPAERWATFRSEAELLRALAVVGLRAL